MVNKLARRMGFIKRERKLSAFQFVNSLMFSVCSQANTSLPDISADLAQCFDLDISKEGLHKKFTKECVLFLKELVKCQLSHQLDQLETAGLENHFSFIKIKDSTKFALPCTYDGDYPGFNNFSKKNGLMNLQYEYDLLSGNWTTIALTNTKRNDQQDSKETAGSLLKKGLYIRDLGYVTPTYLKALIQESAFFLNRLPPQASIYTTEKELIEWENIDRKFKKTKANSVEMNVLIYQKELIGCRLIVERLSEEEYKQRLEKAHKSAKKQNLGLSKKHKIRCRYNAFITNVEKHILPIDKIRKTYYLRWQVELVFKTWKSFFQLHKVKKVNKERMECQLLAKLLWILLNWRLFQACNQHVKQYDPGTGVSVLKFFKRCLSFSQTLRGVVLKRIRIVEWLSKVFLPLIKNTKCETAWKKQTHYHIINSLQYH